MIRMYNLVEETATHVVYQYNTLCGYWLYASVALTFAGYAMQMQALTLLGALVLLVYFALVYFPGLAVARRLKAAMRMNNVQLTGSRWSFAEPLTIRALKTDDPESS